MDCSTGAQESVPNLTGVKPYVIARDGGHRVLADLSPAWDELGRLKTLDERKEFLVASALLLVQRDARAKYPQAMTFDVRIVRVVEYDNYNRPMLSTAKELLRASMAVSQLPADGTASALRKAARAFTGAVFATSNFP